MGIKTQAFRTILQAFQRRWVILITRWEMGSEWIKAFHEATKNRHPGSEKRILLMDNHISHCTENFIFFAADHNIIPYCFIPSTTGVCQPLDSTPFLTYKNCYRSNNNKIVIWGGTANRKIDFFREIRHVRSTLTPRIIKSGFQRCEIWNFDPSMVLEPLDAKVDYGNDLVIFDDQDTDIPKFNHQFTTPGYFRNVSNIPKCRSRRRRIG